MVAKYNTFVVVRSKSGKVLLVTSSAKAAARNIEKGKRVEVWSENVKIEVITSGSADMIKKYIKIEKEYVRKKQRLAEQRNRERRAG